MNKIDEEDKRLFFEEIRPIQGQYSFYIKSNTFRYAEMMKKKSIREHILKYKDRLLKLRDKINGSK